MDGLLSEVLFCVLEREGGGGGLRGRRTRRCGRMLLADKREVWRRRWAGCGRGEVGRRFRVLTLVRCYGISEMRWGMGGL